MLKGVLIKKTITYIIYHHMRLRYPLFVLLAILVGVAYGLDNGLGRTPPMGWNSWNKFGCKINQTVIKNTVDQLIKTGLRQKGYKYVNLDDCWQIDRDPQTHEIQYDKTKFPSGFQNLIDYVHKNGFLFGLYSDAGTKTCQGRPGSYGYERVDAKTYARWKVDYLKYDNCHNEGLSPKLRYPLMRNALNETGRPIYFSMCEWGRQKPHLWAQPVANSWRTTIDIKDFWQSFLHNLQNQVGLAQYAGPGGWNDPDMLQVGNGGMSHDQYQCHFALWAILKAPLLIGCDLNNVTNSTLEILGNEELIAINQDPLGIQADRLKKEMDLDGFKQVWGGKLSGNRYALLFFNRSETPVKFQFKLADQFPGKKIIKIRDVIKHQDVQIPSNNIIATGSMKKHTCITYVLQFA